MQPFKAQFLFVTILLLTARGSSLTDLNTVSDGFISQWLVMLESLAETHHKLGELTADEDWPTVAKWLNKI